MPGEVKDKDGASPMDVDVDTAATKGSKAKESKASSPASILDSNITLIQRSIEIDQALLLKRVMRTTNVVRTAATASVLSSAVEHFLDSESSPCYALMMSNLQEAAEVEMQRKQEEEEQAQKNAAAATPAATTPSSPRSPMSARSPRLLRSTSTGSQIVVDTDGADSQHEWEARKPSAGEGDALAEVEAYLHILVIAKLMSMDLNSHAVNSSAALIKRIASFNRHSLDGLSAKAFLQYSLSNERGGAEQFASIRGTLLRAHRTACLRHDDIGQATLLNLLLRNYIASNMYDMASRLIDNAAEFPAAASNNQFVRYLYYRGRIDAIQCDYSESYTKLSQALRKCPRNTAVGFRIAAQQLACIVQLLMGEVPERSIFNAEDMRKGLRPYLELTQAVKQGELTAYASAVEKYQASFKADGLMSLVRRLRHSVIKTGLRNISLSYSRISFEDICEKLRLENRVDAEYVVAKAIRDGVIDATIDHNGGFVQSSEGNDIYSTAAPTQAFHDRISFCLEVRNEAVKSMSYAPDAHKKELEEANEKRKDHEKEMKELIEELEKEDEEEEDGDE